jgi:hypothetical protein
MRNRIIGMLVLACLVIVGMAGTAAADEVTYNVALSGTNEVDGGDVDGTGTAAVTINDISSKICVDISVTAIDAPNAAHIHAAAAGINGDVVVNLDWPANLGKGCVSSTPEVVAAILASPANFYVNVHNAEFPGGAVRGQLAAAAAAAPDPTPAPTAPPAPTPAAEATTPEPATTATTELAVTGSNLTTLLAAAGAALVVTGGALVRTASKSR